jgi:hypothetical protein
MRTVQNKKLTVCIFLLTCFFIFSFSANAEMTSSSYRITSDVIGSFGSKESSSSFELGDTGGELGTGTSSSLNFNLSAGFWAAVGDDPLLIVNISDATADLGTLNHALAKYDTGAFNIASTAQGGYVVQFSGTPLSFESNTIDPLAGGGVSDPGTEQFGFNLVYNTTPTVGIDPAGGYGQASTGYNTQNSFKFSSGDTIAESSRPTGETDYTVSFIGNVNVSSEAGEYQSNLTIMATGRY